MIEPTLYFEHYKQVYSTQESLEKTNKRILYEINKTHLVKLAMKYEKEPMYENDPIFAILKRLDMKK